MSDQGACEWCGNPIPPRLDPRGRRAKYCSDACRAAATRDRNRRQHTAELEAARSQTTIQLRRPDEVINEVVQELNAAARIVEDRGQVSRTVEPVLEAARRLVQAAERKAQPMGRRDRRRADRKAGKPGTRV
ncbi:hypothetical protein [Corynebacterium appendicis]|uniref:hypothetical protein n=1 Tax=Corynebacterium appendicis TaxID=163202 RepID=UPI000970654A|nr:hypothetical protein [Corynebacterium appendicis]